MSELERPTCPECKDEVSIIAGINEEGLFEAQICCEWCDSGTVAIIKTNITSQKIKKYVKGSKGKEKLEATLYSD